MKDTRTTNGGAPELIRNVKFYTDGSSFIGIPPSIRPSKAKKPRSSADTNKQAFETAYAEAKSLPYKEREKYISEQLSSRFDTAEQAKTYVANGMERKRKNTVTKRTRLWRKARLQRWNYFCTFTYDGKKWSESEFKTKLANTLRHFASRRGWKYIGVWELSPINKRLHFHALVYIPDGQMVGEIIAVKDWDNKHERQQITYQNTFFNDTYGRSDFKAISQEDIDSTILYLVKYIEKDGGKIVYSRGLPMYFVCDIIEDDILARCGNGDKKLVMFDNFNVWDEGEYLACICPQVIDLLPKSN